MERNVLLRGFLYVTNYNLIFYSSFNDESFGEWLGAIFSPETSSQTLITIPLNKITQIEPRRGIVVFENSFTVHADQEYWFTFIERDVAINTI